nr:DUF1998 domain-containing protein [Streptacidiphilus albus]
MAIADQSYIIRGLDSWDVPKEPTLHDVRLEPRLNVDGFHRPPATRVANGYGVHVRRFPKTYSCSKCNALGEFADLAKSWTDNRCTRCEVPLAPSRFMMACEDGHLDEFPYWDWIHADPENLRAPSNCSRRTAVLALTTDGRTASLRSIVITCSCGLHASMEGAFGRLALRTLKIPCRGYRPWIRGDRATQCTKVPQTLQRGSSAAWFPELRSALSIPPWHTELMGQVQVRRRHLVGKSAERIEDFAQDEGWLDPGRYTAEQVLRTVRALELATAVEPDDEDQETFAFEASSTLRQEEYEQLRKTTEDLPENEHFVCEPPSDDADPIPGIDEVMQVKRLREVRALTGFTRIRPSQGSKADRARIAALSSSPETRWLPAIDVVGEGVFLTLDPHRLEAWEAEVNGTSGRVTRLRAAHEAVLAWRGWEDPSSPLTARFVLLHTLAHALINEWSLDCGYPAASLRERLYVNDHMAGVLLYTATSDSAGSLGGIVAQGERSRLERSLAQALDRAAWCSSDPLCMEADSNGADGLNLAACHTCILLPETSCELNNTFLDRAHLVGTPDGSFPGYFPQPGAGG